MGGKRGTPTERFWRYVARGDPDECWLWTGSRNAGGYGTFNRGEQVSVPAHRFAYELLVGPIPQGAEIDHLCRVRLCVNPAHLDPVAHRVNIRRGSSPNREKTHCIHGHEFTPENTWRNAQGWRWCRACFRRRAAERKATP